MQKICWCSAPTSHSGLATHLSAVQGLAGFGGRGQEEVACGWGLRGGDRAGSGSGEEKVGPGVEWGQDIRAEQGWSTHLKKLVSAYLRYLYGPYCCDT